MLPLKPPLKFFNVCFKSKRSLKKDLQAAEEYIKTTSEEIKQLKDREKFLEEYKRKSDLLDMLGDIKQLEKLMEEGTVDSIIQRLEDYTELQKKYNKLEEENNTIKIKLLNETRT